MINFRTEVFADKFETKIGYSTPILTIGSCFSENIGDKIAYYKFPVVTNPFGILYNPASIARSLLFLLENREFTEEHLFFHNGLWNSFHHHGSFSSTDKKFCIDNINAHVERGSKQLFTSQFLLITFGTAWVFQHKETGEIVANCHKVPAKEFNRFRLSTDAIVNNFEKIFSTLNKVNKDVKIVLTVSPVRHLKDGAVENQLSKATLIQAVHELSAIFDNVNYFPSYEIMMDDLRDYRFYKSDMVHPSEQAIDYIWDKFRESAVSDASLPVMKRVEKINSALVHRPFNPKGEEYGKFVENTIMKMITLEKEIGLDFSKEKRYLLKKIM